MKINPFREAGCSCSLLDRVRAELEGVTVEPCPVHEAEEPDAPLDRRALTDFVRRDLSGPAPDNVIALNASVEQFAARLGMNPTHPTDDGPRAA